MNRETVASIFTFHSIDDVYSIQKIEIGFTNAVFSINNKYILKVCKDIKNENRFEKEVFFYELFKDKIPIPKLIIYDETKKLCDFKFIIYPKIKGDNLYAIWHILNDDERKHIVKQICGFLRIINNASLEDFTTTFNLQSKPNWQKIIVNKIHDSLLKIESENILDTESILSIKDYVSNNKHVLIEQNVRIVYWDIHFDNVLVNDNNVVGILDFERTECCSIDFVLDVVKRMVDYPKKYVSAENEQFAVKKDYKNLMTWYKEYYPELFDFEHLDLRLALYSIEHDLDTLIGWPDDIKLKEIIMNTINPNMS